MKILGPNVVTKANELTEKHLDSHTCSNNVFTS